MSKTKRLVFTILMALFTLAVNASAQTPKPFIVEHVTGKYAGFYFDSLDATSCINTVAVGDFSLGKTLVAVDNTGGIGQVTPGEHLNFVDVSVSRYNFCTSTLLLVAESYGSLPTGSTATFGGNLRDAHLKATVLATEQVSGKSFPLFLDLTLVATAPARIDNHNENYKAAGFAVHYHFSGVSRPAVASGSVSDGSTNFAPGTSTEAILASVKGAVATIENFRF